MSCEILRILQSSLLSHTKIYMKIKDTISKNGDLSVRQWESVYCIGEMELLRSVLVEIQVEKFSICTRNTGKIWLDDVSACCEDMYEAVDDRFANSWSLICPLEMKLYNRRYSRYLPVQLNY